MHEGQRTWATREGPRAIPSAAMTDASTQTAGSAAPSPASGRPALRLALVLVFLGAIVGASVLLVGGKPRPADDGFPDAPPPLALPSDAAADGPLAKAAAQLAAGRLDAANRGFVDVVAEDQDDVAGQVGLVLSRWRTTGPRSVERDLAQLTKEYPESALAALHLGMVQTLLDDGRVARATLRDAVELGQDAGDPTSLRMARLADDLLHPSTFRGPLPVLIAPDEVAPALRGQLRSMLTAVGERDRATVAKTAAVLTRSSDDFAVVAATAAAFDKDEPDVTVDRLDELAADSRLATPARDRARMLAALAMLWRGDDRADGCRALEASTEATVDAGTRRLAAPISAELCADGAKAGAKSDDAKQD